MDTLAQPGDVVLVHIEEKPSFYARIEEILPDRKAGWRQLRLQALTFPTQELTWILEPSQIDGEPFTMGGTPIQIERLADPVPAEMEPPKEESPAPAEKTAGTVIAFPGPGKP